jgi:uncharacterized protein
VQEFLNSGLTPESADRAGYTPIHAAASYGHLPLLRSLVKDHNGDINIKDTEGDTPLHMCELVDVAREMIQELGADVTIKNKDGMTAAEAVREEGDFDDLADYLESITPGITPANIDTSALEYTEFREDEDKDEEEVTEAIIPPVAAMRIDEIMRLEEADGVNRDDELRSIVTEAILMQMGRAQGNGGTNGGQNRRQRRESNEWYLGVIFTYLNLIATALNRLRRSVPEHTRWGRKGPPITSLGFFSPPIRGSEIFSNPDETLGFLLLESWRPAAVDVGGSVVRVMVVDSMKSRYFPVVPTLNVSNHRKTTTSTIRTMTRTVRTTTLLATLTFVLLLK